jgi:2-oxoglutarate ferredoxin oxidoreductase subunit beta
MKKGVQKKVEISDYTSSIAPTWCPGCGNFVIKTTVIQALVSLKINPWNVVLVYDIGCNGNGADKTNSFAFKSLHGRSIPPALGIKYANKDVQVISMIGDGGAFWEGPEHIVSSAQRNEDITVLVADNQIYALTTGQTSPTTEEGYQTVSYPAGTVDKPLNPIQLALACGATFVARGFVGEPVHLTSLIKQAIKHKGFAFVDILQNCVTYNKLNTVEYYKERIYKLEEEKKYNIQDRNDAFSHAVMGEKVAIGVFYKTKEPTNDDKYRVLKGEPLFKSAESRNLEDLLGEFK